MAEVRPVLSRFAPSPTGHLHLGHLVNMLYVWGIAHVLAGRVILRIEDHDRGRCRIAYENAILEDLEWLGFAPDLGQPALFRAGSSPFRQSDCTTRYEALLQKLVSQGMVYTCTCSRKDILSRTGPQTGELRYDGHCRRVGYRPELTGGTRLCLKREKLTFDDLRLGFQTQCPATQCGDLLLKDRHGNWTYQFCVTADDWEQGINLVIRGEDLLASTARQIQLARHLGRINMPFFLHHPLISDTSGKKLSKRDFSKSLRDYRREGKRPEDVLGKAARRIGLIQEEVSLGFADISGIFSDTGSAFERPRLERKLRGCCQPIKKQTTE